MGGMSRRKGCRAEVAVVNWLRSHGWPDARRYLSGDGRQPGDVDGVPGVCIEVKDHQAHAIPAWLRQVELEAGPNLPVVVVKERGEIDPGRWWAVSRLEDFAALIRDDDQEPPA